MSAWLFDSIVADFARGEIDWERDPVKLALFTGSYVPSQTSDDSYQKISRFEVKAAGDYRSGGSQLKHRTVDRSSDNNVTLHAGSASWENLTGSFRYAVAYRSDTGQLIGCADLGNQTATNARVSVDYSGDGFAAFTVAAAI